MRLCRIQIQPNMKVNIDKLFHVIHKFFISHFNSESAPFSINSCRFNYIFNSLADITLSHISCSFFAKNECSQEIPIPWKQVDNRPLFIFYAETPAVFLAWQIPFFNRFWKELKTYVLISIQISYKLPKATRSI